MKNKDLYTNYNDLPNKAKNIKDKKAFFEWLNTDAKILDDEEKKYIRNVVLPFYDSVLSVEKKYSGDSFCDMLVIRVKSVAHDTHYLELPPFRYDSMYLGMKADKRYTLKELGIEK